MKTEPRCKICTSPYRGEIEDFIALQAHGGTLDDGTRVSIEWIKRQAQEWWGFKLNDPNIQRHRDKHFRIGDPGQLTTVEDSRQQLQRKSRAGELERHGVDDFLESIVTIAANKASIDPERVTIDHGLKAAAELTKRRQDDAIERQMMQAGAGLAAALGVASKLADKLPDQAAEIREEITAEAEEVVDELPA